MDRRLAQSNILRGLATAGLALGVLALAFFFAILYI
jgi:hypothetical protein